VLLAFRAWHEALPWFPIANRAERAVSLLTEMLADDGARREVGAEPLGAALARLGATGEPGPYAESGGVNPDAAMLAQRLDRLDESRHPLDRRARAACWAATLGMVVVPVGILAAIAT
jgi:hypothetical protein